MSGVRIQKGAHVYRKRLGVAGITVHLVKSFGKRGNPFWSKVNQFCVQFKLSKNYGRIWKFTRIFANFWPLLTLLFWSKFSCSDLISTVKMSVDARAMAEEGFVRLEFFKIFFLKGIQWRKIFLRIIQFHVAPLLNYNSTTILSI